MQKLVNAPRVRRTETALPTPPDHDLVTRIGESLLAVLGNPPELSRVQVKPLWGNRYRANVFVGSLLDVRLAHSYFLEASTEGEIVSSSPPLKLEY